MSTSPLTRAILLEDGSIDLAGNRLRLYPAESQDKPFIISTWVRSYQVINRKLRFEYAGTKLRVDEDTFHRHHPAIAEELWPFSHVLKPVPDQDHGSDYYSASACLAYVTGQPGVFHYAYVVPELRRMGLTRAMVQSVCGKQLEYSHVWPYDIPKLWKYNPYLTRGQL